jgi:HlyD family secretion protein
MQVLKKYWLAVLIIILLAVAGGLIYKKLHPQTLPSNLVEGTGRMDGDLINLNTKYPGRVDKIFVDDGVAVTKGMIVGILKSKELEAQKEGLEAQIKAKRIEQKISKTAIPLQLEQAKQQLSSVKASKNALEQNILIEKDILAQAKRDFQRSKKLYKQKSIDKHAYEMAKLKVDTESKKLASIKEELKKVESTINLAKIGLKNAKAAQENLLAIQAGIEALQASKEQL